tara:strand:+ start:3969 stop:4607 length:639 start_codon:yes stop_codon:yes gene_type:complete
MNLVAIEIQLQKRLQYPYKWYRKQNDTWDNYTNFIYNINDWDALISEISLTVEKYQLDKQELFYYAINRWYNFWSAMAVEKIFCSFPEIKPALNSRNKLVDFTINDIPFDHKTSVFPKGFNKDISYAKSHKRELINWLYENQSNQKRHHLKNRLFIIVYANNGEHWKLKAAISLLNKEIKNYVLNFNPTQLQKFIFTPQNETFSDIIWVELN